MPLIDRAKLLSWEKKAQARVNDLQGQLQAVTQKLKLSKNVSLSEALKARQKTIEADLRKAKANLSARRLELERFDARGVNPGGDAA